MKSYKIIYIITIIMTLSCNNEIDFQENNSNLEIKDLNAKNKGDKTDCGFEVHGIYIDNGMPVNSDNNILVFPSQESFLTTIEYLELLIENYDDNFLAQHATLSEDELDEFEEDTNYNPDLPLEEFENFNSFYSLRYHYYQQEETWLNNSDNTGWSWEDDPTDNLLVEGAEQTVYNPYYEFIVCRTLYKLTDSGIVYIPVTHPNLSLILTEINNGKDPSIVIPELGGVTTDEGDIRENLVLNLPEPSVPVFETFPENNIECIFNVNRQKRFVHPNNNRRSVKGKQKMRTGPFNKTYKAVTKSYKKRGSKWKKRRTQISAGLAGTIHNLNFGCPTTVPIDKSRSIKKKRRREVSHRIPRSLIIPGQLGANHNELKSRHHQNGVWHEWTFGN